MNLLYIAHRIPYPPNKGDKIRSYHQIRQLGAVHEVDLCTLFDDPRDQQYVGDLSKLCAEVTAIPLSSWGARARAAWALATGRSFSPAFFCEPGLRSAIAERCRMRRYDAVVLFGSMMGALLPWQPERGSIPCLADYCDLDSAKWAAFSEYGSPPRRALYRAEARRLGDYEQRLARDCHRVVFATAAEAEDFCALYKDMEMETIAPNVEVVPNGVDHDYFAACKITAATTPTVVFTGAMDYLPNFQAME